MIGIPNPYVLIAGGVGTLAIAGSLYYQSTQIHSWHVKYENSQTALALANKTINDMTFAQNSQTAKSDTAIVKVVQGPREVQSIIKEVEAAPAKPCAAPTYSDEVKSAF